MAGMMKAEKEWKSGMGQVVSDGCLAIIDADEAAKDAQLYRLMELVGLDNVEFKSDISLVGMEQKLQTGISLPALVLALGSNIGVTDAKFSMSLDVSQHEEQSTGVKSDTSVAASASGGFLVAKGSVKTTAKLGVSHDRKRSSDYRSTVNIDVNMAQTPPPEAVSLIVDALTANAKRGLDLNESLVQRQADRLAAAVAETDNLGEGEQNAE